MTPLPRSRHRARLALPAGLPAQLGYDAVGMPVDLGKRIMRSLPRIGCVFADDQQCWWIVPAGSDIDVAWPPGTSYAVGARMTAPNAVRPPRRRPRVIHHPHGGSPYTPPIPLYVLTCHLTGTAPSWSPGVSTAGAVAVR